MSATPDVLASPALPLLLQLESDGFAFSASGNRLLVRPVGRLTPELLASLRAERAALLMLVRICDGAVQARREAFADRLVADGSAVLPALVFKPDIPYVPGLCFSCGDSNERATFGRCWRCSLAWRLAVGLPIPDDVSAAYDAAKRVA